MRGRSRKTPKQDSPIHTFRFKQTTLSPLTPIRQQQEQSVSIEKSLEEELLGPSKKPDRVLTPIHQQFLIGQGGFGRTFLTQHPTRMGQETIKKQFKDPLYFTTRKNRLKTIMKELKKIDPRKEYFGGWITQQTQRSFYMQDAGISLDILIDTGALNQPMVRNLFVQFSGLLDAIQKLGNKNFVHGDIKLANIVWGDGRLRLIDFDYFGTVEEYIRMPMVDQTQNFPGIPKSHFYLPWPFERSWNVRTRQFWYTPDERKNAVRSLVKHHLVHPNEKKVVLSLFENVHQSIPSGLSPWIARIFLYFKFYGASAFEDPTNIDVYSLGIVALQLFIVRERYKLLFDTPQELTLILPKLDECISLMSHPNPRQRKNPFVKWEKMLE